MLSPPIQRQASSSSLGPPTPPSPGPVRPGRAVKNYFELYPRTSPAPVQAHTDHSSPVPSSSRSPRPHGKSREGPESGSKPRSTTSSRDLDSSSVVVRDGRGSGRRSDRDSKEAHPHRPRSASGSARSKGSAQSPRTPRSVVPPPRTSSAGAPSSTPPDRIPPRTSSRIELNHLGADSTPSPPSPDHMSPSSSSHSPSRSSRPRPAPLSPAMSSPSRPHHLPSTLVPSAKLSPFDFASTPSPHSPKARSFSDQEALRSVSGRMSVSRTPPTPVPSALLYSSRSVSFDTMDALVDSMHEAAVHPRSSRPELPRSRTSTGSPRKGKERAIYPRDSSASEDDLPREPVRPRPGRPARPPHFVSESAVSRGAAMNGSGRVDERVAAWVDQEQVDADRRRRRQGLPPLHSPSSASTPPRRSQTLEVDTSIDSPSSYGQYLSPLPSPSCAYTSPSAGRSLSSPAAEERWVPIPVGHPAPAPKSPSYIPSINDIIKSGLAREAAKGVKGPLPSAFAPPISPSNRTIALPATSSDSLKMGSRKDDEPASSDGEAQHNRGSVDSPTPQAPRSRLPIASEHLRTPKANGYLSDGSHTFSTSSPPSTTQSAEPLAVQQSRSLPPSRTRPNSTSFERSPSLLVSGRPGGSKPRQSSSSSVRSVSTASTAHRPPISRVSTDSSNPGTPQPAASYSKDPNLDHALLLRSSRLTRLITLDRHPNQGLVVSLSDVGASTGHPVFVYLGLGGVRYLTALFDELAESLGLRLICIDRWGLGKTGEVPADRRGFLEWGAVVDEVADQLGVTRFSILAHSAGAPYSLATCLRLPQRIFGSVHLLAPWVSMDIDGGYRWLKYVPSGVIKATQAAEWRMQGWRMGKPPTLALEPVGHTAPTSASHPESPTSPSFPPDRFLTESEESYDDLADFAGHYPNGRDHQEAGGSLRRKTSKIFSGAGGSPSRAPNLRHSLSTSSIRSATSSTPDRAPLASVGMNDYPSLPIAIAKSKPLPSSPSPSPRTNGTPTSIKTAFRAGSPLPPPPPQAGRIDLGTALLRASHAENQRGTADLLAIMEKSGEWGFSYTDVGVPVKVWYGDRDDKISEKSVRWMERSMPDCTVKIMKGEGHNLLSSTKVVIEVLESIAKEAGTL